MRHSIASVLILALLTTPPALAQNGIPTNRGDTAPADPFSAEAKPLLKPLSGAPRGVSADQADGQNVVEVRIEGNQQVQNDKIMGVVTSKANRPLDLRAVENDVRSIDRLGKFVDVRAQYLQHPDGVVIIFQVVERPIIRSVSIRGNRSQWWTPGLFKAIGLKEGDGLDSFAVEEGRRRLEDYYINRGYADVQVTVEEGLKANERDVKYLINEGVPQKVFWVSFRGNKYISARRLKTQIKTKPPIAYVFQGNVNKQEIDEDLKRLEAYYRKLGFFQAEVGRELIFGESKKWLNVIYVVNEGPRYQVREVAFEGNQVFSAEKLSKDLKLKAGKPFNQDDMSLDLQSVEYTYGTKGYIDVVVKPETRLLEEPGELDLVYHIVEGDPSRINRVDIEITGDNPHTKMKVVRSRLSLHPGDILSRKEVDLSERRVLRSGLFANDPTRDERPKIIWSEPLIPDGEGLTARAGEGSFRGQDPASPRASAPNRTGVK